MDSILSSICFFSSSNVLMVAWSWARPSCRPRSNSSGPDELVGGRHLCSYLVASSVFDQPLPPCCCWKWFHVLSIDGVTSLSASSSLVYEVSSRVSSSGAGDAVGGGAITAAGMSVGAGDGSCCAMSRDGGSSVLSTGGGGAGSCFAGSPDGGSCTGGGEADDKAGRCRRYQF